MSVRGEVRGIDGTSLLTATGEVTIGIEGEGNSLWFSWGDDRGFLLIKIPLISNLFSPGSWNGSLGALARVVALSIPNTALPGKESIVVEGGDEGRDVEGDDSVEFEAEGVADIDGVAVDVVEIEEVDGRCGGIRGGERFFRSIVSTARFSAPSSTS